LDLIPKKKLIVALLVPLVNLLLIAHVSLVPKTDIDLKIDVLVLMDIMKLPLKNVLNVTSNVLPVKLTPLTVSPVPETESMLQNVTVQSITSIKTCQSVHHVQMLVKNVTLMETVLFVPLTEIQYQLVHVFHIILKPMSKINISVKFVMLDVVNVITFSTCVIIVLKIL